MGTLFKIAWRNVWRHGKRTLLTIITMAFGLGMFIWMDSILKGMDRGGLENIIELTDSSLRISTKEYEAERRGAPLEFGLPEASALSDFLKKDERVLATSERTRFIGQLSNGIDIMPVFALAVWPDQDAKVFSYTEGMRGQWFPRNNGSEIVLGSRLAADLGVDVGDWIVLQAKTRFQTTNADDFAIVGILETTSPEINNAGAYVSFQDIEEFLELDGLRTEMAVRMVRRVNLADAMADSDQLAAAVDAAYPALEAQSFGEIGRSFMELAKVKGKSAFLIVGIMLLIASLGIANTILMSVFSRVREIGVLRAFGLRGRQITRLFIIEGGIIGVVGALSGVVVGILLVIPMVYIGFPMDTFFGTMDMGLPITGNLYGEWNPGAMLTAAVLGFLVALLASRSPAKKASKLEVTDALRFI